MLLFQNFNVFYLLFVLAVNFIRGHPLIWIRNADVQRNNKWENSPTIQSMWQF